MILRHKNGTSRRLMPCLCVPDGLDFDPVARTVRVASVPSSPCAVDTYRSTLQLDKASPVRPHESMFSLRWLTRWMVGPHLTPGKFRMFIELASLRSRSFCPAMTAVLGRCGTTRHQAMSDEI